MQRASPQLPFDAYVILDFEATCQRGRRIDNQEIIEFPFVVVDARSATVVTEFQRYVKPLLRPKLSDYCRELTGIMQEAVDQAQPFPIMFEEALSFLRACKLGDGPSERRYCMVTCGDWDLKTMLPEQIRVSTLHQGASAQCDHPAPSTPSNWLQWCNIKKFLCTANSAFPAGKCPTHVDGMMEMLHCLGIPHKGREHSGIDDCRNIAAVVCALIARGCPPRPTWENRRNASRITAPTSSEGQGRPVIKNDDSEEKRWPPSNLDLYTASHPNSNQKPTPFHSAVGGCTHTQPMSKHVDVQGCYEARMPKKQDRKPKPRLQSLLGETPPSSIPSRCGKEPKVSSGSSTAELPFVAVNTNTDVVNRLVDQLLSGRKSQSFLEKTTQVSKALTFILRHNAVNMNIPISVNGFVRIDHILSAKKFPLRNYGVADAVAEIVNIVRKCPKQRFTLGVGVEDPRLLYIAANQGHSIAGIEVDMTRITSADQVPTAVHGTNLYAWNEIKKCGYLSCMNRLHMHFAKGLPQDGEVISGMRSHSQVLLYLNVAKVLEDNILLLESANGVLLTPGVDSTRQLPLKYFSTICDRDGKSLI